MFACVFWEMVNFIIQHLQGKFNYMKIRLIYIKANCTYSKITAEFS